MHSSVVKRSVFPAGHKTSVSLEDDFWKALKEISGARQKTQSALIHEIDQARQQGNLSSAIRLFVLKFYRGQASATVNDNMSRTRRRAPETEKRRRQGSLPLQQQSKQAAWITIGTGYQPQSLPRSLTAGVLAVGKDAHAEKNLVSAPHDTEGLASAIAEFRQAMQAHKLATRAQISIEEHLHDLETECSRARPRKNKVGTSLQALKSTLDGVAGFVRRVFAP